MTSPFQVVYGRWAPTIISYESCLGKLSVVDRQLRDSNEFLADIKDRLSHAQDLMCANHDRHHCEFVFQVGDWVWLRLDHLLTASITDKLALHFYGPFHILDCIGSVAYRPGASTALQDSFFLPRRVPEEV